MVVRINVMYRDSFVVKLVLYIFFAVEVITMTIMSFFLPGNLGRMCFSPLHIYLLSHRLGTFVSLNMRNEHIPRLV